MRTDQVRLERRRRVVALSAISLLLGGGMLYGSLTAKPPLDHASTTELTAELSDSQALASAALDKLPVKGRAPKTGFSRQQFGDDWAQTGNCTMRDIIMARDFAVTNFESDSDCTVVSGVLHDPYTGKTLNFSKQRSSEVQIDHVIALSDAWQKGAQQLTPERRAELANDPLELLAADGPANMQKSDGDAATWLPPNKPYRCRYVARQIAVKAKYQLWVTPTERDAMRQVLASCPQQVLPIVKQQT